MNKLSASQVDKLIELIKESPVIFDKSDKYYKLVSMKDKKWQDISNIVGADENECKTAWKSLRTQFVKAVNGTNRKSAEVTKTYKYFDKLLFLKNSIRPSKNSPTSPNPNYDKFIEECDDPLDENDTDMFDKDEDSMEQIKPLLLQTSSTPRFSPPGPSKRIKSSSENHEDMKEFLETIVTEIKSTNETQPDDTQAFFVVIANMVRNAKLTRFQHRQLQKKVFNFVTQELDKLDTDEGTIQYPITYN